MKCPICDKESQRAYRPFCSKRCADVDLGRWFNEDYRVAGDGSNADDESTSDPSSERWH